MSQVLGIVALVGIAVALAALGRGALPMARVASRKQAAGVLVVSLALGLGASATAVRPISDAGVRAVPATSAGATSTTPSRTPEPATAPRSAASEITVTASPTASPAASATALPQPVVVVPAATSSSSSLPAVTTAPRPSTTTASTRPVVTTTATKPPATSGVKTYMNCDALRVDYPHGVARTGGVDRVNGVPKAKQPAYVVDDAVYTANRSRDADNDGVACEK